MNTTLEEAYNAKHFGHFSVHNAVKAELACDEGTCRAYEDI
jgi:hypothetical protein